MQTTAQQEQIDQAIDRVAEGSSQPTGGKWLEYLTADIAPQIREWDIARAYVWGEWPERPTDQDIGIDVVAIRRSDGEHIAIQCKSRQLDEHGRGSPINKREFDSFASPSASDLWAERWIVTNGDVSLGPNVKTILEMTDKPVKMVNIASDLQQQRDAFVKEECPHCQPNPEGEERQQSRSCMQNEAVSESVRILQEHECSSSGGLPGGQARGRIILPCGTGKTRISLRIVEELTPPGQLSIVLCPSIALVAQLRREYLQHAEKDLRALAVCSDETAGYDPKKENTRNTAEDPTADSSNVSASEVKGKVTTNSAEIAQWIREGFDSEQVSVIFGTYQSGSRVADALKETGVTAKVLIADEAHRTAGLRRKRSAKNGAISETEKRIRDFTLCHDNDAFPATYRVYQTATPRIYDTRRVNQDRASDWVVRTMDDETVFGVELYRKSYVEAVRNGWLADYRIIAVGVNGPDAYQIANTLAGENKGKGTNRLTSTHFLRGLAFSLAMGGATHDSEQGTVSIKSCIAFMNTTDKSNNMQAALQTPAVRKWIQDWLDDNQIEQKAADYKLEHLEAKDNVTARDNAKVRLAEATSEHPHGILNVGIFGEGTDSPSLSAVAFLEARKSPIDVIQAVGRAMRTSEGKEMGYIICPIVIPANADPEQWLSTSDKEEGWQELGQILLALRAHDQRIEDNLVELLHLHIPKPPEVVRTLIAIAGGEDKRIQYREHQGAPGEAQAAVERVLEGKSTLVREFRPISEAPTSDAVSSDPAAGTEDSPAPLLKDQNQEGMTKDPGVAREATEITASPADPGDGQSPTGHETHAVEMTQIVVGKGNYDGAIELRMDTVARAKPAPDGTRGPVDFRKSKDKARDMINKGKGVRLTPTKEKKPGPTREERMDQAFFRQLKLSGLEDQGNAIRMNLLSKSGLVDNRVARDLNILETSVKEAAHHLREDQLQPVLDRHFMLDNLDEKAQKAIKEGKAADGCVTAALLLMNAAMLHQRIANGRWLSGISNLSEIKHDVNIIRTIRQEWKRIMCRDFHPVLEPAVEVIDEIERTGRLAGLERALRHLTAEAERIAETYADMGADHAGPLFNKVMGNQASDGAFFTKPVAGSIAARLTLDALGEQDWTNEETWRAHKTVDLACGSGTLLTAMLTEMKRRAREQGATPSEIGSLQKTAVEDTLKGMDINPISLQLAASQLMTGNQDIGYRRMGLHRMPYGPQPGDPSKVSAGTLELLGQKEIVKRSGELDLPDDWIASEEVWTQGGETMENAVDAVKGGVRIVIMNPPFSNRSKMGEKFPQETQRSLRKRVDDLERLLVQSDKNMDDFVDKNSIRLLFAALAERCIDSKTGIMTTVLPTIALTATSGQQERRILSERFHIHTVLTGRWPREFTLSQNTEIDESIIVATRNVGDKAPTRFVQLDKMPVDEAEVDEFHQCLTSCVKGSIANGWGEVSYWPEERIGAGDWTPAIWRSPELAEAAWTFKNTEGLIPLHRQGISPRKTGASIPAKTLEQGTNTTGEGAKIPVLASKGAGGQQTIEARPDSIWDTSKGGPKRYEENQGHLLLTFGQRSGTGRLNAVASNEKYIGVGWMPVPEVTAQESKAVSVFINSTAGRVQLMANVGKMISFPTYNPSAYSEVKVPDVKDTQIREILADCWERTRDMTVPQFRDGECEVRRLWDEAVAEAIGWEDSDLARLRLLLHQEPHVRGLGYGQYGDEVEIDPADRERFQELADRWQEETIFLSNSEQVNAHPALQEIISMGQPATPLILETMRYQGGHWFEALQQITGADPVSPADYGNIAAMQNSWLQWGEDHGYA